MKIRQAREKALYEKSRGMRGDDLMSAFFHIANSSDIKRMSELLETELKANQYKNQIK